MKELRIEQLAAEAGLSVSTVRYYQSSKLTKKPKHKGRVAVYDSKHLARLREIKRLSDMGFTHRQLVALLNEGSGQDPILSKLVTKAPLTQKALVAKTKLGPNIVKLAIQSGLVKSVPNTGNLYYPDAVEMLKAAGQLIEAGVDPEELLKLANTHSVNIEKTAMAAVKIFVKSIQQRKAAQLDSESGSINKPINMATANKQKASKPTTGMASLTREELSSEIENLMTQTVALVSSHFRQTLFAKAAEFVKLHPGSAQSVSKK